MEEPAFLSSCRVAVLGLGLMGGSLALALMGRCKELIGIDPDPAVLELAVEKHAVDRVSSDAAAASQAELIILAAPVRAILEVIPELPKLHRGSPVVLDLGSTKSQICRAMSDLPSRFDPLGGHPMCGKEISSLANADPGLYRGAPFAFTPLERTTPRARGLAEQLARTVGALPLWIDPESHDRWVASTSHLPYLVANALVAATPLHAAPLVGPGYRSTTRLSVTSSAMILDVLSSNQVEILASLSRFREKLGRLEASLAKGDWPALKEELDQNASHQRELLSLT